VVTSAFDIKADIRARLYDVADILNSRGEHTKALELRVLSDTLDDCAVAYIEAPRGKDMREALEVFAIDRIIRGEMTALGFRIYDA
jgi:hypothetical protein